MIKSNLKKQTILAMLVALGYVLNTFVYFPSMAPFQHMINVIAAVLLGPNLSFLCALMIGILRMMLNGRTILAVIGAVIGAYLSGLCYKRSNKLYMAVVGEVIGTGIISAIVAYPFMVHFYGLPPTSIFTYVPFFMPSSLMGASIGFVLIKSLEKTGTLKKMKYSLENERN
ncbi:MAG: energy coupling factor transporter S component ThiW [Anaerotignum sp.]